MSLGFCSEFQLGLQSILAADGDHDSLVFNSLAGELDGIFNLVDEAHDRGRGSVVYEEPVDPTIRRCPTASVQHENNGDASTVERLCSSLENDQLNPSSSTDGNDGKFSRGGGDPPHRQMVSRFQRLKTIRHPYLCSYTNVLRIQRRVYVVSEHWSLSLQDIMTAWENEGNAQQCKSTCGTPQVSSEDADGSEASTNEAASFQSIRWTTKKLEFLAAVTAQTLAALAYLNSMGLAHNRLEPRTIRIDAHGNVRLSEWGLSYLTDGGKLAPYADLPASFPFLAPEQILAGSDVLRHAPLCSKHDVWALGIILLQILQPKWSVLAPLNPRDLPSDTTDGMHGPEGGEVGGDSDFDSFMEEMKNITQLVLYCALGVDCQVLVPLDPPDDETVSASSSSVSAPTLSAASTALSRWLLHHMPLLMSMMEKAVGNPCYMLDPDRYRSALTVMAGLQNPLKLKTNLADSRNASDRAVPPLAEGPPDASTAAASPPFGDVEAAFFRSCLEGLTHWLSGTSLFQRLHVSLACSENSEIPDSPASTAKGSERSEHGETACVTGLAAGEARRDLKRLLQQLREVLRACLAVHPSSRPSPCDLLAFEWLQQAQRERQVWCSKGSECIGLIAELHVEDELRRVFSAMREQDEGVPPPRALPWLPYSRIGTSNNLDLFLRNHNIGIDELFYWWQLLGGDVHSALLSKDGFQPVPPLFSLPLCCIQLQRKARWGTEASDGKSLGFARIGFLANFADCWVHNISKSDRRCSCRVRVTAGGCILPSNEAFLKAAEAGKGGERGEHRKQQRERHSEGQYALGASAALQDSWSPRAGSPSGTEAEDSFFLTGFTGDRNWRDVQLWKEGDVRVFGVTVDETLRAIQEADRFPVTQMLEMRPPCIYRRQCHFLYQRLRVRLFKSLLAQLPKSRHRLMEEAACDIPPLLRPEVWAALMGINLAGVQHTTQLAYEEAASSLGSVALEVLQTSEFSQYHEYHDLLGSEEGRRRLVTLVGVALQSNPLYVCVRGMDALAAPLLLLYYGQENVALACLEKLLQDFQQHLFAADSASFLRRQLATSNRLLLFLDPELALHMHRLGFSPDEESTAIRLLQASFEFVNIPALCAAAVALQNAVPWSLALLSSASAALDDSQQLVSSAQSQSRAEEATKLSAGHPDAPELLQVQPAKGKESARAPGQYSVGRANGRMSEGKRSPEAQQFFIGEGENLSRFPEASQQQSTKSEAADIQPSTVTGKAKSSVVLSGQQQPPKKSSSWKTRAIMSVMKGPALILLGAPRKPNPVRALHTETEGAATSYADPMEALYSSEPIAPRWWDNMNEEAFLQTTSMEWIADNIEGSKGEGIDVEQVLQPPCIGVDVLLQFYEESIVLDIRPRTAFESLHFAKAVQVTPRDVDELICLLKEGQVTLPEPKGVHLQMQKFGSSRARVGKITRASTASFLDSVHASSDSASGMGIAPSEGQEAAQLRGVQAPVAAPLQPWISASMNRLPLIVVVGDREDSGSGLARRLLMAGVSCVCVLLGGIEALQLDAPYDFLTGSQFALCWAPTHVDATFVAVNRLSEHLLAAFS